MGQVVHAYKSSANLISFLHPYVPAVVIYARAASQCIFKWKEGGGGKRMDALFLRKIRTGCVCVWNPGR